MFTPPPSPLPVRPRSPTQQVLEPFSLDELDPRQEAKKVVGRRFRMAVILIPLLVILLTTYISYGSSRVIETVPVVAVPLSWHGLQESSNRMHHRRQPEPEPQTGSSSPQPTSTLAAAQPIPSSKATQVPQVVPTVPSAPPTLPTPFPQTFDAGIAQNFSSVSCSNFFANMTNSASYRSCRPFSLLLQNSAAFITAQSNLTLMNSIIWGTCNTTLGLSQCQANMASFADSLKTSCAQELKDNNSMAVATLTALQAYSLMYDAACQTDAATDAYCYVEAVANKNPADSYYYNLPLGLPVPNSATPTCSACSKSLMGIYAAALKNSTQADKLPGLQASYSSTVKVTAQLCGANFASTGSGSSAMASHRPSWIITGMLFTLAFLLVG